MKRRLPIGAELLDRDTVHFRVWAPRRQRVDAVIENAEVAQVVELKYEGNGYFSGTARHVKVGTDYRFRLDGDASFPDPASRFQPEGPHGPSRIIDPNDFRWTDTTWRGLTLEGQVMYELHIGTFTPHGTWAAAERHLAELAELGITAIEVMPVAEFPGRFGWGYDGVSMFAPTRLYGTPNDFRRFVNHAHAVGLGVILDVVYNHIGPDGNYLAQFSNDYFTDRYENEWSEAINFDGPNSGPVREFFLSNAAYWIREFHLDGLRLDATQQIFDGSPNHILAEIGDRVREAAEGRKVIVVAENELQHSRIVRPREKGGYGLDGIWNDDFHHSAIVALTGRKEAYFTDYLGEPQEFISTVKWGYLFQGQHYKWQKQRRGTPSLDVPPAHFVTFLENHDQIANLGLGARCHQLTSPGRHRAMTAFLLLAPGTPLMFQGQEFNASAPFVFFADHHPELGQQVSEGRKKFLSQFPGLALREVQSRLDHPTAIETFQKCKLDHAERERNAAIYALHRDLLALRRSDPAFRAQRFHGVDGAVLASHAFVLRFFVENGEDRLLVVNLGRAEHLDPAPEPLLAPPEGMRWRVLWSSEDPLYGGTGTPPLDTDENWRIPGEAAVALFPRVTDDE